MKDAVALSDVSKRFRLNAGAARSLQEIFIRALKPRDTQSRTEFWALRDVNLRIEKGETVGIVGSNGSGKSTLLRLIAGILRPTCGNIVTEGRISPLLELGAGFHPDLSGRENVFLNGSLLGLGRREMAKRMDDIVAFSELSRFIDTPIKHYSSGMYLRLGFAVAVSVDPDILLIDEVLAVGDFRFQEKCLDRIRDFQRRGKTLIVVSHDSEMVTKVSDRALWLHRGHIKRIGSAQEVIQEYHLSVGLHASHRPSKGGARILRVRLLDQSGCEVLKIASGESAILETEIVFDSDVEHPNVGFYVSPLVEHPFTVYSTNSTMREMAVASYKRGDHVMMRSQVSMHLVSGIYAFTVAVTCSDTLDTLDWVDNAIIFRVIGESGVSGIADLDASLEVVPVESRRALDVKTQ